MTLTDYIQKVRDCGEALPAFFTDSGDRFVLSLLAIRINRIQSEGILKNGKEGTAFEYSENKVPTGYFRGKELNAKGTQYIEKTRLGTWHDFRIAQGLTNTTVNLSYSNRMLTSLHITRHSTEPSKYIAVVGSTDPIVLTYIGEVYKRYGNFIKPTETEFAEARRDHYNELTGFLRKYLG